MLLLFWKTDSAQQNGGGLFVFKIYLEEVTIDPQAKIKQLPQQPRYLKEVESIVRCILFLFVQVVIGC